MKKIKKAVIVAAGYGTRFLPETKSVTKEMLPIIDKPIVQYLVEEIVSSGIEDIIFVTRGSNNQLPNHFDGDVGLETHLEKNNKIELLEEIRRISQMANFIYVRQSSHLPYGTGTPILCVKDLIEEDEPFAYIQGDDLVMSEKPALLQLMENYYNHPDAAAVIASQEVGRQDVVKFGIVDLKDTESGIVNRLIEKPTVEQAPSNLAAYGRYILTSDIIRQIEKKELGKGAELWLADAINVVAQSKPVYNTTVDGQWLTTGDPLNYLKATIAYALKRSDLREELMQFMHQVDK